MLKSEFVKPYAPEVMFLYPFRGYISMFLKCIFYGEEFFVIFYFSADIGGSMGLFLGCSFLTLCEFLDLLIMVCIKYFPRKSNYQLKSRAENHRF